jgi:L-seryl-tRNA(Ser) seleniumtransferase
VALPVFKTGEVEQLGLAGSIPVRLRHRARGATAYDAGVDPRRLVPRTDVVLADPRLQTAAQLWGPAVVKGAVTAAQARARAGELVPEDVADAAVAALPTSLSSTGALLNATGVVLHTNLGRASLSPVAVTAVTAAAGYTDVEFDLATGSRARRGRGALEALSAAVPAAESVLAVNNGAAALVLATTALAAGREIVISRGEMVEIGDGFRLPELIASTGARLREVGTTNRTTAGDYAAALGPATGCILKVHPSNFRIEGFTSSVGVDELARLGVPVVVDIGSGLLGPDPLLPDEPDAETSLRQGADLVTASGDKLLGGPQAGLLLGRTAVVERLRRHPLARALRVDKLTLAALEVTLRSPSSPTWTALRADPDVLRARVTAVVEALARDGVAATTVESDGAVGGGGAPGLTLPGWAIALPESYTPALRRGSPVVVGRTERGRCLLDLRCVPAADDVHLLAAVQAVPRESCS